MNRNNKGILLLLLVMLVGYYAFGFVQEKMAEQVYLSKLETAQQVAMDIKEDIKEFEGLDGDVESEASKKLKEKLETDRLRLESAYVDLQNTDVPAKYLAIEIVNIKMDLYSVWGALKGAHEAFNKKATRNEFSFQFVGVGNTSRRLDEIDFTDCMDYSEVDKILDDYFMRKSMYYRSHR